MAKMYSTQTTDSYFHADDESNQLPREMPMKTYFNRNGKVFTEDFILVRKLYITCCMKKVRKMELYEYLLKYGTIRELEFVTEQHHYRAQIHHKVYVMYHEPEAAYRLLLEPYHDLGDTFIKFEPVPSWLQPEFFFPFYLDIESDRNIHALRKIANKFSYSTEYMKRLFGGIQPGAQIRLTRINEHFRNFFVLSFCRDRYKNFRVNKMRDMTLWEIRDLLHYAGEHMMEISGQLPSTNREFIVDLMAEYCPNLQHINLVDSEVADDCFGNFMKCLRDLRQLHTTKSSYNDTTIQLLEGSKQLESLSLSNNCNFSGKYLKNLQQLKHLGLYGCGAIQHRYLMEACDSLENLRSLDIRDIDKLNPEFYNTISKHCHRIEVLKMSCRPFTCNRVALMPKLKHLELLHRCHKESLSLIDALVQLRANHLEGLVITTGKFLTPQHIEQISKLKKLKTLSITSNGETLNNENLANFGKLKELEELTISACKNITNQGLVHLLRNCPKLQTVYIEYCERVTCDLVNAAVELAQNDKRKFKFYAHATAVQEVDPLQCADAESLVDIDLSFTGHNLGMEYVTKPRSF